MARRRTHGRPVNGILLLDKPMGATSNAALQQVKRLFQAQKAGHTGSLDPLATGVLPICLGEATKASAFLLDADKHYRVVCKLGETTSTQDAEGEVLETRPVGDYDLAELEAVLDRFRGPQEQVPPMFSAVKHEGQRLYKLARQGIEVERKARSIVIHELSLLSWESPNLEIEVHCSKGTYVRTLAEDIGEVLGCGAHVTALRRTGVGPYGGDDLVTLEQLEALAGEGYARLDALLLPMESALAQWPGVRLTGDAAFYLRQGQPVLVPKAPTSGWVRLYEGESTFLGMGEILDDGRVAPRRLMKTA
ncbi:MAG: tRNA pseudouridine(55) synthase TruB [Gammaproteobacteria bacterium]|nr:tRNA pseudouridine(55) synthase TruB [Gammaproteobacteria bacterium]MCW9057612.1 tRNA pseudouridine(55) synthase TruB [Gammaproteobacteria bacterium]